MGRSRCNQVQKSSAVSNKTIDRPKCDSHQRLRVEPTSGAL
jgi:hypothetical protein